jgi:hypothetical protein
LTRGGARRKISLTAQMARKQNIRGKFQLAAMVFAALCFSGCGRNQTAPLSEGGENSPASAAAKPAELPLDQQTEQKLDPLTKDDVDLYVKIMRAAAERAKNRAPADQATLEEAQKIMANGAAGRAPNPEGVKTLARATLVAVSMDQIVAEEMKVDGRTYRGIAEAVESVIPNPAAGKFADVKGAPPADHVPTPLEKRLSDVNAANAKFLAPYRDEIQSLIGVVRNPANLPK